MSQLMPVGTIQTPAPDAAATHSGLVLEYARQADDLEPIVLVPGRYHIGSGDDCEIQVPAAGVAPRHCLVVVGPRKTVLKAFSPLTWVNESPIREGTLQPGDRFVIGPVEFAVRAPHSDETEPVPEEQTRSAAFSHGSGSPIHEPHRLTERPPARDRNSAAQNAEWTALAESRAALHEQRDYLARLATTLEARDRELQTREVDLRARWDELEARHQQRKVWELELQQGQEDLSRSRSELKQERQQVEEAHARIESQRAELDQRRDALDARAADVEGRDSLVREASERLQAERSELELQRQQLQAEEARLQQQADALALRESELRDRQSKLDSDREQLARDQDEFAQQQADWRAEKEQIADARSALDESRRDFQSECQRIDAARAELVQLRSDLEVSRADSGLVRRAMESEREQLEAARHQIAAERTALEARIRDWEWQQADLRERALHSEQLAAERQRLAEDQSALERQRASLTGERQALDNLRAGVDADREELQAARTRWEAQQAEWTADARQLDAERGLLALERQRLQAERERVEALRFPEASPVDAPQPERIAAPVPPLSPEPLEPSPDELFTLDDLPAAEEGTEYRADDWIADDLDRLHVPPDESLTSVSEPEAWGAPPPEEPLAEADAFVVVDELPHLITSEVSLDEECAVPGEPGPALSDQPDPEATGAEASDTEVAPAVRALRSQLAELFGISSQTAFGHSQLEREEPAEDLSPTEMPAESVADEPLAEDAVEEPTACEAALPEEGPLAETDASVADEVEPSAPPSPAATEGHGDSISAYMERLLARSRTSAANSALPAPEPERRRRPAAENDETASAPPPPPAPPPLEMPSAPPKSIAPEERVALRANIDSFRELANASARSAVAKHESKKLRTMVQIKVALAIIAGGLTVLLFVANSVGRVSYGTYALASAFATVVMTFDLARTVLAFYRWKSVESAAVWDGEADDSPEGARAGAAGDAATDDNTTNELPVVPIANPEDVPAESPAVEEAPQS